MTGDCFKWSLSKLIILKWFQNSKIQHVQLFFIFTSLNIKYFNFKIIILVNLCDSFRIYHPLGIEKNGVIQAIYAKSFFVPNFKSDFLVTLACFYSSLWRIKWILIAIWSWSFKRSINILKISHEVSFPRKQNSILIRK